ncbi:hypothetical protein, partial [Alistipes finegoldii]
EAGREQPKPGGNNRSRAGIAGNRAETTGAEQEQPTGNNQPGTPEHTEPMKTQVPATEKAAGTIECP